MVAGGPPEVVVVSASPAVAGTRLALLAGAGRNAVARLDVVTCGRGA
jgi:hypothetical protein